MRPSCQDCARKHLAQASVLIGEAHMGYPDHHWLAIGHLAEAAEELLQTWPDMANQVRAQRKRLELDRNYQVPVMDLIAQVGKLGTEAPSRDRTVASEGVPAPEAPLVDPPPIHTPQPVPCAPCDLRRFATDQAPRYASEQLEIGPGKQFSGRLVVITTLGNFDRTYSLASVIIDQVKAAVLAGLRVDLWVNKGCDLKDLPKLPYGVSVVQVIPPLPQHEDVIGEKNVQLLLLAMRSLLDQLILLGPVDIIGHDLIFQSWFVDAAKAIHQMPPSTRERWWHMAHSSVNNRLPNAGNLEHGQYYRSHLPQGHRLLAVNASDVQQLAYYYHTTVDRIDVLPNSRDPLTVLGLTPAAVAVAEQLRLLEADVIQIMPLSADRLLMKGALELVRLFGSLHRTQEQRVALVFVVCNAQDDRAQQQIAAVKRAVEVQGLPPEAVAFTSDVVPTSISYGLSQADIRGLFALSNLFAFPTVSEAASLVVWEAMLAGCLMVLNDNLPCMREQLPRTLGLWAGWPSHKEPGAPSPSQEQVDGWAEAIVLELGQSGYVAKRHALQRTSLAQYSARLATLLGTEGR